MYGSNNVLLQHIAPNIIVTNNLSLCTKTAACNYGELVLTLNRYHCIFQDLLEETVKEAAAGSENGFVGSESVTCTSGEWADWNEKFYELMLGKM